MIRFRYFTYVLIAMLLVTGCDNNDPVEEPIEEPAASKFIIAATPVASEGVADYLLLADAIDSGMITTVGNGVEQDGTYRYYVQNDQTFVSLLYGQGNPGAVTAYKLNADGELEKLTDFQSETVAAFGTVNDDVLMIKMSRSASEPMATWYSLGMGSLKFDAEGTINQVELAEAENEMAYFSWVIQATENKVYLPFFPMFGYGTANNGFGTNDPDRAFIAVYSYPEMEYQKTMIDTRTSFIGKYFTSGITVDEKGDAYAFSPSYAQDDNYEFNSTKPSAISKINTSTDEFDTSYLFSFDDKFITNWTYSGSGKFVANYTDVLTSPWAFGDKFAIIDVYNKTLTDVTGTPAADEISSITGRNSYATKDGKYVYVGITTDNEGSYVYKIDVANAKASRGLKVEGGIIKAIHKIEHVEE